MSDRDVINDKMVFGKTSCATKHEISQDAWIAARNCQNIKNPKNMFILQLDEPLWQLSRLGCSNRENGRVCPVKDQYDVSIFCNANSKDAVINPMKGQLTLIKTKYPDFVWLYY